MQYYDYTNLINFLGDADIIAALEVGTSFEKILQYYTRDEILELDETLRVPFFAQIRNYTGACEKENPDSKWIVKKIDENGQRQTEMATVCFFVDHLVKTLSAPSIITKIGGVFYKATKVIFRSEQLSGANYTEIVELKEQLMLDLINRWIYCDEDRNPNNYLIKYSSQAKQLVIAVDFLNVDLLQEGMKIEGNPDLFGWSRLEKTRYLTPLKAENFLVYDMSFFNMRFDYFKRLDRKVIEGMADLALRHNTSRTGLAAKIADNLLYRVDYVYNYFSGKFPLHRQKEDNKYSSMGKAFINLYDKFK